MKKINLKENIILYFKDNPKKVLSKARLIHEMKIRKHEKRIFDIYIKELIKEGILVKTKKDKLVLNRNLDFVIGKIYTNSKGFGFVVSAYEKNRDLFIPSECIHDALHEDRVVAKITKEAEINKRAEGEVICVLSRKLEVVIGTYIASENFGFVIPDNQKIKKDIYISQGCAKNAQSYDKVVCQITKYPQNNRNPEGQITEIIGVKWDKGVDVLSIIKEHNIKTDFPIKVLKEAEKLPECISDEEYMRRLDLRDKKIFTIDGEDAKDLDDAISIDKLDNGNYSLGVHIADVSHYVKQNSKIDNEALKRGTSVYLIDTVIPMLPKRLSNHLCSLSPGTDKLTLSVFMEIDKKGKVVNHEIYESIVKSVARLTYNEVSDFLEKKDNGVIKKYPFIEDDLKAMEELAYILMKKREHRGSIEFYSPESYIKLDEDGKVIDVTKYERRIANDIIEEFMLVCNETVAEDFYWSKLPFIYRIHESPREEKLEIFSEFIKKYGYKFPKDFENITPKDLQELLKQAKGKKEERAINLLLLQSMKQARYNPDCKGHFGLSTKFYCHFTSPIRRYPDLQIHRIIKDRLNNNFNQAKIDDYMKIVEIASKISSRRERIADSAERELDELKKIEFMEDKNGQVFEGVITSLNTRGVYITLDNTVEGFLKIDKITDDEYEFIKDEYTFVGKNTGNTLMIGDSVLVSVGKVDIDKRELLFDFISK